MRRVAFFVLLFLSCMAAGAAGTAYTFSRLSVEDGLPSNCVSSIAQDGDGNMWFATNDGLARWDGYGMRVYRHDPSDEWSLQSNIVNRVRADRGGRIWACTANGLSLYDNDLDRFRRFSFEDVHSVEDIVQAGDDLFIITTRNFSRLFRPSTGEDRPAEVDGNRMRFYSSVQHGGGFVFATMSRSLVFAAPEADSLRRIRPAVRLDRSASSLCLLDGPLCMAALQMDGLLLVDLDRGSIVSRRSGIQVSALERDAAGNVWVGTSDRVEILDPQARPVVVLRNDPLDRFSLSPTGIRSIFRDATGGMWVATEYGGVSYWNPRERAFTALRPLPGRGELSGEVVTAISSAPDGSVWIGFRTGGLDRYLPSEDRIEHLRGPENVRCFWMPGSGGPVYMGSNIRGLNILDPASGGMTHVRRPSDINSIVPARGGKLFLGALVGLLLYEPATQDVSLVQLNPGKFNRILVMAYDSAGLLWIGSKESLAFYRVNEDNTLEDVSGGLLDDIVQVQCLHESSGGVMWIGYADGLLRFDRKTGTVERVQASLLHNTVIRGIEEDGEGNLWLGTDSGLCKFDPASGETRIYYSYDGLPCDQFNIGAHCTDSQGRIWFGGIGGAAFFRPEEVANNPLTHAPQITGLYLNNEEVRPGDGTRILSKVISRTPSIVLKHNQNSVRLTFSCPDYASGGRNIFACRLSGFDKSWIESPGREAIYSNLRKGRYRFELRVANSDGVWCPETASLLIRVRPPWYGTLFAEICFILAALAGLIALMREILRRNNQRNAEAMQKMKARYEEKMRHARVTAFLANPSRQLGAGDEAFLCQTLDLIDSGLTHPQFSVETLASKLGMSRANLHLRLKALTGMAPIDIITRIRLDKATELIRDGSLTFAEIAERTGFNSASYFSSCFKKATGLTPKEYSLLLQGNNR